MALVRWLVDAVALIALGRAEHSYRQRCKTRANLTDVEFYDAFYRGTDIPIETCTRIRRVLKTQLRMANVRPDDNVATIFDDIDVGETCFEIGEEFELKFPDNIIDNIDGTIDSLIRATERLRKGRLHPDSGLST